jgi:hypothetical protein
VEGPAQRFTAHVEIDPSGRLTVEGNGPPHVTVALLEIGKATFIRQIAGGPVTPITTETPVGAAAATRTPAFVVAKVA